MEEITEAYETIGKSPDFQAELARIRRDFQGRPTPITPLRRLSQSVGGRVQLYAKREDLNHTGAHKLNHCMGEALLAKRMGKKKVIAETGAPAPVYSVASGLDYPSSGPEHAFLRNLGRVTYDVVDDRETVDAFFLLSRLEGILPAIESAHAVAYALKLARRMDAGTVLLNLSGRGDKDLDYILEHYGKAYL